MIELHSYFTAFKKDNKIRPGFRDPKGILWVFTHTKPDSPHLVISRECIVSKHFRPRNDHLFLVPAENQSAHRYNNVSGGYFNFNYSNLSLLNMKKLNSITPVVTNESLGLSPAANLTEVVDVLQREQAGTSTDEDAAYLTLEKWADIRSNYQDLQIKAAIEGLPFEGAIAITNESRQNIREATDMLLENPAEEVAIAVLCEAGLTHVESAPATDEELATLVEPTEGVDTPDTNADDAALEVPDSVPQEEAQQNIPATDAPAKVSTVPTLAPVEATHALGATKAVLEGVKKLRQQQAEMTATLNELTENAIDATLAAAAAVQAQALPATIAEDAEVVA